MSWSPHGLGLYPPDHAGQAEVGEEAGLDQRRLARAAGAEYQHKGLPLFDTSRQDLAQFVAGAAAAEEERGVSELERAETAIGVAARPLAVTARPTVDPPRRQRVQMVLEHFLELCPVGEGPGCSARVAAIG